MKNPKSHLVFFFVPTTHNLFFSKSNLIIHAQTKKYVHIYQFFFGVFFFDKSFFIYYYFFIGVEREDMTAGFDNRKQWQKYQEYLLLFVVNGKKFEFVPCFIKQQLDRKNNNFKARFIFVIKLFDSKKHKYGYCNKKQIDKMLYFENVVVDLMSFLFFTKKNRIAWLLELAIDNNYISYVVNRIQCDIFAFPLSIFIKRNDLLYPRLISAKNNGDIIGFKKLWSFLSIPISFSIPIIYHIDFFKWILNNNITLGCTNFWEIALVHSLILKHYDSVIWILDNIEIKNIYFDVDGHTAICHAISNNWIIVCERLNKIISKRNQ